MDGDVFLCETVLHLLLSLPVFKPSIVMEGFFSWLPHVLFKESLIVELLYQPAVSQLQTTSNVFCFVIVTVVFGTDR